MDLIRRRNRAGGPLGRLHNEMDELFGRFFEDWPFAGSRADAWWPALDIAEHDDGFVLKVELPGVKADDIEVSVVNNVLTISGVKKEAAEKEGENYYHVERRHGSFRREVQLPGSVDPDKVEATFRDGVLRVNLTKTETAKARRIEIKQ
jgi:HSP20 family protein